MDELLLFLIWNCASGMVFFIGVIFIIISVLFSMVLKPRSRDLTIYPLSLLGVAGVILSATPLALWLYLIWGISIILWLIGCTWRPFNQIKLHQLQITVIFICCLAVVMEVPYHLRPKIAKGNYDALYIIGDSVSAGLGGKRIRTWPEILGQEHNLKIKNLSQAGATIDRGASQAKQVENGSALVIIEIGGNDILALQPTSPSDFENSLRKILELVKSPVHNIIIFELPLMPFQNEYGRIQRKLAREYGATLIPKHYFVRILSTENATTDLVHLSQKGHEMMYQMIWSIIDSAFAG